MERITFSKLFDSLGLDSMENFSQQVNILQILINLAAAFVLAMFIYWIYKITFSGVLYSKNFNITLVLVSLVTTSAVIVISSNIVLALGMVGALSIVRFRMAVKDPKDVGFLFWAITNGIICGISAYSLAIICALFIGLVVFILSKKINITEPYLIIAQSSEDNYPQIEDICSRLCMLYKLRSKTARDEDYEIVIEVKLKKDKLGELTSALKALPSIKTARFISYEGDLEEG
jgi:uncharacterized membrane protein YhiD involved in acid resistance